MLLGLFVGCDDGAVPEDAEIEDLGDLDIEYLDDVKVSDDAGAPVTDAPAVADDLPDDAPLAHPYVFHGVNDQASVPRLVEDLLRLPRMRARDPHARDARAGSLLGAFDFLHADDSTVTLTRRACP